MTSAALLWLIDAVLALLTLVMARNVLGLRGKRARAERARYLSDAVARLGQLPESLAMREAWYTVISQSTWAEHELPNDLLLSAIYALAHADIAAVQKLREVLKPRVNLVNDVAEFIDEGLLRPKDVARKYPDIHAMLLEQLALMAPFIWYESIIQGMGRWGYRPLRLKIIFEQLRPISPRHSIREPMLVEIVDLYFVALSSVSLLERAWGLVRFSVRSPTINVRSKIGQSRERERLESRLLAVGLGARSSQGGPRAVEW